MNETGRHPLGSLEQAIEDGEMTVASRKVEAYEDGIDESVREVINQLLEVKFHEDISDRLKEYLTRYQLEKILRFVIAATDFDSCKEMIIENVEYHNAR